MAKAIVKKSKRGNDLIQLTMGPKEAACVQAVLGKVGGSTFVDSVYDAIDGARFLATNTKQAEVIVSTDVQVDPY